MKDRCGFLFVRYKRQYCTELVSWEHAACPLSIINKRPLVGGWLNTSSVVISFGATASVHYREVVHLWEGLLWEVPLYRWENIDLTELPSDKCTWCSNPRGGPPPFCATPGMQIHQTQKNTRWIPSLSGWKRLPSIWLPCGNGTRKQCQKWLHISYSLWMQVTNTMDCIGGCMILTTG